ncbi:MAG: nucleotidyl transferase AbiEii/AbiGii toxin family protein [Tannerella sp.]|nr:nucleotidyl transferase AbiEii/AbiGii toxin family protein [Tannerella sp.]
MSMETEIKLNWVQLPLEEKQTVLANIAEKKGIDDNAVEKDFWVSMVLKAIFCLPCSEGIVFKGGTSLGKGWGLIERFSEDCDLAIDRAVLGFGKELSGTQRNKLIKKSKKFINDTLVPELEKTLNGMGFSELCNLVNPPTKESDKDPVEFFVEYNSVLPEKNPYIAERVKIEISCRSLTEPFERVGMRSMIEDAYPDEPFTGPPVEVPTVLPGRTFLEKIFLLHEEFNRPGGGSKIDRLTRHFYDIEKVMDEEFAVDAMNDESLYSDIVEHRSRFTAWSGLNYQSHHPSSISFLPPESLMEALEDDYKKMQEGFIYGNSLSYEGMIERLTLLQERFKRLTCNTPFFQI